jgi:hypothetical protein
MLEVFGYDGDDKNSDNDYNDNYNDNYISNKIIIVMTWVAVVGNGGLLVVMEVVCCYGGGFVGGSIEMIMVVTNIYRMRVVSKKLFSLI